MEWCQKDKTAVAWVCHWVQGFMIQSYGCMIWMGAYGCRLKTREERRKLQRWCQEQYWQMLSNIYTHTHTSQPHTCTNGFPVVYRGHYLCLREKVSRWKYFTITQYYILWMKGKLMKMRFFVFCALRFSLISFLCNVLISNKLQFLIFYLTFISLLPEE